MFVLLQFQTNANSRGWWEGITLGLSDRAKEGTFLWEQTGQKPGYTNWFGGGPNDFNQNEDCVSMMYNGQWNDVPCDYFDQTIMCEKLLPKS